MTDKPKTTVVHIDDETHAALKAHCKKHGLQMTRFVNGLVEDAVAGTRPSAPIVRESDQHDAGR